MRATAMAILVALCLHTLVTAGQAADFASAAAAVRTAMAQRDLPGAKQKLDELKLAAATESEKQVADRLDLLYGYLFDFWKSVHEGGQKLLGAEEIVIGQKRVAVVEYDAAAGKLVLRVDGENKRYTLFDMPPRIAITLSEQVLKKGAPQNEAFIGTFLAMDGRGDRKLAEAAWQRAQQGGVDVKSLLPELAVPLPAAATIQLPTLTPQTALLLRPQAWQLVLQDDKGWKRSPLGKQGVQNTQGRLEVETPEGAEGVWLVFARKMPSSFGMRIYFADLPAGQRLGLMNSKAESLTDASVALPTGLAKVEFGRRSGKLLCRINDQEQEVTISDEKLAQTNGTLGISLPAGVKVEIAGCELAP